MVITCMSYVYRLTVLSLFISIPTFQIFFSNPAVCIEKFKRFEGFILFMELMLFGNSSPCLMSYVNRLSSYVNHLSSYVLHPDSWFRHPTALLPYE